MNFSTQRVLSTLTQLTKTSPLSIALLLVVWISGLDLIRDHGRLSTTRDHKSSLMMLIILMCCAILWITSWIKTPRVGGHIWHVIWVGICAALGRRRTTLIPEPSMAQWISMWLVAGTGLLALVWISLRGTQRTDRQVHHRLLDIIEQCAIARLSVILFAWGISLAFVAIDSLFGISIDGERYATIWLTIALGLWATSLLEGIMSADLYTTDRTRVPKRKRMLAGIIWVLLLIFGVILYVYMWKILITRVRPSNEVTFWSLLYSWLVIVASVILLPVITPQEKDDAKDTTDITDESDRLYTIRQWLFASILPMCLMSGLAISQRVEQYGVTVERYLVIIFTLWLAWSALWMLLYRKGRIRRLFVSAMGVGLWSLLAGPWSASGLAVSSQKTRLLDSLIEAWKVSNLTWPSWNILNDLPLIWLTPEQEAAISWPLSYLVDYHDMDMWRLDSRLTESDTIFDTLWIERQSIYGWIVPVWREQWKNYYAWEGSVIDIAGYTTMYPRIRTFDRLEKMDQDLYTPTAEIVDGKTLLLSLVEQKTPRSIDLSAYIDTIITNPTDTNYTLESLSFEIDELKIIVHHINLQKSGTSREVESMEVSVLER